MDLFLLWIFNRKVTINFANKATTYQAVKLHDTPTSILWIQQSLVSAADPSPKWAGSEFEQTMEVFYRITSGSLVHDHGSGDRIYGGFLGNVPLTIILHSLL